MSTILDALRKIEREKPGPGGQARARLLVSRPQPLSPTPSYRARLWAAGVSFLLAGCIVGVWMTRQQDRPPADRETPPVHLSKFEEPEQTAPAVVTAPPTQEQPLVLSEPPPLRDSPFVSPPQGAPRPSLVDTTPQRFSETAGEGIETPPERGHEQPADRTEPDEPEEVYAPAPANSAVSFLQWSPEAARRKAFVRVGGSPLALVREGDAIGGYTVVEIRPNAVALQSGATRFQIRVR